MALDEGKIREQAKAIMDEFIKALDKAGNLGGEAGLERQEMVRDAKPGVQDKEFRERMLKNAPKKDGDHIIAERKSW